LYVDNIYYNAEAGSLTLELPTNFEVNNVKKIVFEANGNVDTLGAFKLFSGTDLSSPFTNTSRYSVQLNSGNDFEIFDNVNNTWRIRINATTGITTFNPPQSAATLAVNNEDTYIGPLYPTFLPSSATGNTSALAVLSTIFYDPSTQILTCLRW
jgi:hypothetical protein